MRYQQKVETLLVKPLKHIIGIGLLATLALTACTPEPLPPVPKTERNATGDLIPYPDIADKWSSPWAGTMSRGKKVGPEIIDETHIRIPFKTGPAPDCFKYDAQAVETPETITVTLFAGWIANSDKLCPPEIRDASIHSESIVVELKDPVNGREIIDGTPEPVFTYPSQEATPIK